MYTALYRDVDELREVSITLYGYGIVGGVVNLAKNSANNINAYASVGIYKCVCFR